MASLTVRLYNVRFGDAMLISIPDRGANGAERLRHILIDVGNAASKPGGENAVFAPAFEDILAVLDGQPLDLYVMTHEHLDHVQGPLWAERKHFAPGELARRLDVQHLWMPASAEPGYYDTHADARRQLGLAQEAYAGVQRFLAASGSEGGSGGETASGSDTASGSETSDKIEAMMRNNNRFLPAAGLAVGSHARTADCVDFIRSLAPENRRHYVNRSLGAAKPDGSPLFDVASAHPFEEAELAIWAPEEDSSEYYGRFRPLALGALPGQIPQPGGGELARPPAGVDAAAFYNLVEMRTTGHFDNLLAIDKAANNSGIVFSIRWRGWQLLFPGDAELRSWKQMNKVGALSPIHFLKIGHHGSHNGTPHADLLSKLLPMPAPNDFDRLAAVSTFENTYNGIPDSATVDELEGDFACPVHSTLEEEDGAALTLWFEG